MRKKVLFYIISRNFFYYFFLFFIYFILKGDRISFIPIFIFIGFNLLDSILNIIYLREISIFLLIRESLIFSFFCIITGGPESPFLPFYFILILITSFNLSLGKTYLMTTIISILLCIVIFGKDLIYPEMLSFVNIVQKPRLDLIIETSIYIFLFFLVSSISVFLSERLRKEIKRIKIKTEDILNSIKIGIITTDLDNNILSLNRWARDIFSLKEGMNLLDTNNSNILKKSILNVMETGKEVEFELNSKTYSLTYYQIEEGKGKVFIITDITEKKELTKKIILYDRMATIGKFAADIAHELRNPFMSIRNAISLLQNDNNLNKKEKEKLWNYIILESDRIEDLIKDFLTYSKDIKLEIKEVKLKDLLKEVINSIRFHPSFRKDVKIILKCEDIKINVDPERFKSVISNLIDNSFKAIKGKGIITIRAFEDKKTIIEVEDNGEGIPENLKNNIFQPFFTTRKEGAGFGLAIVKKIVELHNGNVSFKSKKGKTVFRIEL